MVDVKDLRLGPREFSVTAELTSYDGFEEELEELGALGARPLGPMWLECPRHWRARLLERPWRPWHNRRRLEMEDVVWTRIRVDPKGREHPLGVTLALSAGRVRHRTFREPTWGPRVRQWARGVLGAWEAGLRTWAGRA